MADRHAANLEWIDRVFARATRTRAAGVLLAIQADMWDPASPALPGFDAYKARIAERAARFGKPVLLLNGDSHVYYADSPFASAPNLERITVNGSTSCPHEYLRVRIDARAATVFSTARVPLPSSTQLCA